MAGALLRQLLAGVVVASSAFVAGRGLLGLLALPAAGRRPAAAPDAPSAPGPGIEPLQAPGSGSVADMPAEASSSGTVPAAAAAAGAWGAFETATVATALGLVALADAGLLLGLAGLLRPLPVALVLVGLHLAGAPAWAAPARALREVWRRRRGRGRDPRLRLGPGPGLLRLAGVAGVAAACLPFALLTLYPPTAFDATLYHLPYARAFAATGSLPFLPELRIPIFPQLQETLFAMVLLFAGDVATQVIALLDTLLTLALLLLLGRRVSPGAGWIAAAAYAGTPLVAYLAATAYVEPALVLFATAALHAAWRWRDGAGPGWLTLAALFAGAAADVKYLGLFVLGLVAVAALAWTPRGAAVSRWRRLARVALAGGIAAAPWYARILAATGNPVFPFLPGVFGSSRWDPTRFQPPARLAEWPGVGVELLRLPWDLVFARQRLGGYPPYSPLLLLAVPFLVAGALAYRRVRALLLVAAAYALVVIVLRPDARYLLVALPLVCLALGESLAGRLVAPARRRLARVPPRAAAAPGRVATAPGWRAGVAAVLALLIFLPGWAYAAYQLRRQGPVPVTAAEREAFLARALPSYPAIRYLERACGGSYTLYAIHAENLIYFAAGRFLGDWAGPAAYDAVLPSNGDARLLFRRLRTLGADHLLTIEGDPALRPLFTPAFDSLFHQVYADGKARLFALRGTSCRRPGQQDAPAAPAAAAGRAVGR